MNIMSYLTSPAFEEFADAPVGTDQLAHSAAAPGTEVPGVAPAVDAQSDNLEIPESTGPALVATADEAQAAAVVDDPGHAEAEQAAQAASAADTAVIEQAEVAPGETPAAAAETPVDAPAEAGGDELGDTGAEGELGDTGSEGGEADLGDDVPLEGGDETVPETEGDTGGDGLGDESGAGADTGSDLGDDAGGDTGDDGLSDLGGEESAPVVEEDGLGDDTGGESESDLGETGETGSEEGGTDGLDDAAGGDSETGETEGESTDGEAEGESETGEEEAGETEEGESEEAGEESGEAEGDADSDEGDGIEVDIPDVDTETDEEDAAEAEEEADEAAAKDEELEDEIVDTSKSISELEEDEASVENYIGALTLGCQRKSYNVQTVGLAQAELQRLAKKWGQHAPLIPALEDYSSKNLDAYYTNSLESFSGFLKKIKHVRDKFLDDFAQKMNEKMHLKAVETQVAAINTACDAQINRIKGLELAGPVTITVPAPLRHTDGILKGVTAELRYLGDVAEVFAIDRKFLDGVAKVLKDAIKEGDSIKSTSIVQKALKLPLPVKAYPASVFEGSKLSTLTFERSDVKATGSMVADMKSLEDRAIPVLDGGGANGTGPKTAELSKAQLIQMLKMAKILIGMSRGTASAAGKALIDQIDVANRAKSERNQSEAKTGDKGEQADNDKAMNALVSSFLGALWTSSNNYANFQWHLIAVADALVHCVQKVKGGK